MTEFVKGKVFTIAEVRENKDGQILAKVVFSTTPKFTVLSSFIESFFIKFYQLVKFYCVACTGRWTDRGVPVQLQSEGS